MLSALLSNPTISEKSSVTAEHFQGTKSTRTTENFHHFVLGIWDLYIERRQVKWRIPFYPFNADKALIISDLQYLWRAIYDLSSPLLFTRLAVSAGLALFPAASLWLVLMVS